MAFVICIALIWAALMFFAFLAALYETTHR